MTPDDLLDGPPGMSERAPLPRAVAHPTRGRALVLAPHADDDVIGCGGTAALHAEAGDPVRVIVAFSGLAGDPEGKWSPAEYLELRRREARAAGARLGLLDYEFWQYQEGHEPVPEEVAIASRYAAERIAAFRPDVVYAPWPGEHHIDHHVLGRTIRLALARLGFRGEAWGYEVWTALVPTLVVDVTRMHERKVAALREHQTQLEYTDIVHKGLALSAQRSIYAAPEARWAEGFAPLGPPPPADLALLERHP
jgi:LmbE family N-acetylglucosaminyl deacetylase